MQEFEDFIIEVKKWDIGQSTFSKEKLLLWGKELFSQGESVPQAFLDEYDYLLEETNG